LRRIEREVDAAVKLSDKEERHLTVIARSLKRMRADLEAWDRHQNEELINIRQQLAGSRMRLTQLQDELTPRSELLEERRGELAVMESAWKATSGSLSGKEAPGSSRALIRSTQRRIDQTSSLIRRSRPVLLTAQNRASEQQIAVDVLIEEVNGAIDAARSRLFDFESEPLWRAVRSEHLGVELADSIQQSYSRRVLPLFDYAKENKRRFWIHLFVSLLLIWLLIAGSRRIRAWVEPAGFDRAPEQVLFHPVAAGLVISLLLAFNFYPYAPLTVYRLSLLLMVFPLARVVLPGIPREERVAFYLLTVVYLVWRLNWLFSLGDFSFRIFVLVVACLAIFATFWAARIDKKAALIGIRPLRRARLPLLRLAALILLASVIANIFGGVRLATLLAGACIASAYSTVAIFAGVLALESFILPLFHSPVAQMSIALAEQSKELRRRTSILIRLAALIWWLMWTLTLFGISRPVQAWLSAFVSRQWSFGRISFSIGALLLFLTTIWVSFLAARVVAFVAEKDILSRMKLPQGIPATVSTLVRDIIIASGFILALAGAGVEWGQVVLIASAIGVGIGLGLQQLVASFIAGVILMVERQVRVGDVVVLEGVEGTVTRIGLRSSTLRVVDGSELICPNSRLISEELTNWTLSDQLRRVEIQVGVALGTDPNRVLALLRRAVSGHPAVLQRPAPDILFTGFGDSWLIFVVRFFTLHTGWVGVSSEVTARVNEALQDAGIEIATPRHEIHIETEPEQTPRKALEGTTTALSTER